MKRIFLSLLSLGVFAFSATAQNSYLIEGSITGVTSAKAILTNNAKDFPIADTTNVTNGVFTFKGKLVTPEVYSITIQAKKPIRLAVYLENTNFTITGAADQAQDIKVTGGAFQSQADAIRSEKTAIGEQVGIKALEKEFMDSTTTDARKQEIRKLAGEMSKKQTEVDTKFIAANPTSLYALMLFDRQVGDLPVTEAEQKLNAFKALPELANNRTIARIEQNLNVIKSVQVGMKAPDFTMNDPEGNPVKLSDVYKKNKITMIDFWAGWCGPCRAFNPDLVKIYEKYNKDGFGILGVSFDRTKEQWTQAIEKDQLTWLQVSDLQFWDNAAGKLYYVRSIPQNTFVDQNGVIIKRLLHGKEEIEAFLDESLKK